MKRYQAAIVLGLVAWAACAASVTAQVGGEADLVRGWYRQYLQREPGPELQAWVELLRRGSTPAEVQAAILGSDEYFRRRGQSTDGFVTGVFNELVGRNPSSSELADWRAYYGALGAERVGFVRGFLQSYHQEIATVAGRGSATQQQTANQMLTTARLFVDNVNVELAGTQQGRQLVLRGNALIDAVDAYRRAVQSPTSGSTTPRQHLSYVEMAYQAVQSELNNPPGTAPASAALARRLGDQISTARQSLAGGSGVVPVVWPAYPSMPGQGTWPTTPTQPTAPGFPTTQPADPGYDRARLAGILDSVERSIQSLVGMVQQQSRQNYTFQVLQRDLESLWSEVRGMHVAIDRLTPAANLRSTATAVRAHAARIEPQLLGASPFQFTRTYWSSVTSGLDQFNAALQTQTVAQPIDTRPLIAQIDQTVAEVDGLLIRLTPMIVFAPTVAQSHSELQRLRNMLLQLRSSVSSGAVIDTVVAQGRGVVSQYQTVNALWRQFLQTYRFGGAPSFDRLASQIDGLNRLIEQARVTWPRG